MQHSAKGEEGISKSAVTWENPSVFYKELKSLISLIICWISSWIKLIQIHNSHCKIIQEEMSKMHLTPEQN